MPGCWYAYDGQHLWVATTAATSVQVVRCQNCGLVNKRKSLREREG